MLSKFFNRIKIWFMMKSNRTVGKMYWHMQYNKLCEIAHKPIRTCIEHIRQNEPKDEIETRLRLLKQVRSKLPKKLIKAAATYARIWQEYVDTGVQGDQSQIQKYAEAKKIIQQHEAEIIALHHEECPNCPWDGRTIFPQKYVWKPSKSKRG